MKSKSEAQLKEEFAGILLSKKEAFTQGKEAVILDLRTATVVAIFADPKDGKEQVAMEAMNAGWLLSQRELTGKETEAELSAPYARAVLYNYSKATNA